MPLWVAAILGGFVSGAGTLVGRVLLSLGFAYVAYTGINTSLEFARGAVVSHLGGLPAQLLGVIGPLKLGVVISILFSALAGRLVFKGMSSGGVIRRLVLKN